VLAAAADLERQDLAGLGKGTAHGYRAVVRPGAGRHTVCVYAINNAAGVNPLIGCRVVNMASLPIGSVDRVAQSGDGISVQGWALDPDSPASLPVHLYVDGRFAREFDANGSRGDIARVYPGYGDAHGFSGRVDAKPGRHSVCVYGIDIRPGSNRMIGCRTVVVASNPYGTVDTTRPVAGDLQVSGWSIDPSTSASIDAHVIVDGRFAAATSASDARGDLARLGMGLDHGFNVHIPIGGGTHKVCAYGMNVGAGVNGLLACRAVSVPSNPIGHLDSAAGSPLRVRGWALDPNTGDSIAVRILVDGEVVQTTTAADTRPDLAPYYPGFGTAHGFSVNVNVGAGAHRVCAVAENVGAGTDQLIGCQNTASS
jgi:hypothetical protein